MGREYALRARQRDRALRNARDGLVHIPSRQQPRQPPLRRLGVNCGAARAQGEVRTLLAAQQVRLWLVDEANSQIWEWRPREKYPLKRSLWAAEQGTGEEDLATQRLVKAGFRPPGKGGGGMGGAIGVGGGGGGAGGRREVQRARKPGIAADVARTGVAINIPFPAVQSESFCIEIDRLPGENALSILCEPVCGPRRCGAESGGAE